MTTPAREDYLVFGSPQLLEPEIDEVMETLRSAWIGTGPRVGRFEEAFRSYIEARHAIAVYSCTAALHLAMVALDLSPGDEVIVPAMTFASTANTVVHAGARSGARGRRPANDVRRRPRRSSGARRIARVR